MHTLKHRSESFRFGRWVAYMLLRLSPPMSAPLPPFNYGPRSMTCCPARPTASTAGCYARPRAAVSTPSKWRAVPEANGVCHRHTATATFFILQPARPPTHFSHRLQRSYKQKNRLLVPCAHACFRPLFPSPPCCAAGIEASCATCSTIRGEHACAARGGVRGGA
jgi:hypothetical protein